MTRLLAGGPIVLALACATVVAPPAPPAHATPQDTAPDAPTLIAKATAWQGGAERLERIRYVKITRLQVTIHGAKAGEANQAEVRALMYGLARDGKPERLRFVLTTAAGRRTMGFDGERYWYERGNDNKYISPDSEGGRSDIAAVDQALDVLRYLFIPDLARDGKPFEYTGRTTVGDDSVYVLKKRDHKDRRAALLLFGDGSVHSVGRIETEERPVDEDGDGKPDPGGQTEKWVREFRVRPGEFREEDGVKLPTRLEVQVNGQPWITAVAEGTHPFRFPSADDVPSDYFRKPR